MSLLRYLEARVLYEARFPDKDSVYDDSVEDNVSSIHPLCCVFLFMTLYIFFSRSPSSNDSSWGWSRLLLKRVCLPIYQAPSI